MKPWLNNFEVNPNCFRKMLLVQHCIVFYELYDRNDFPLVKCVGFSRDVELICDFLEFPESPMT